MRLSYLFIIYVLLGCSDKSTTSRNNQLAGMYKLLKIELPDSAGAWRQEDWVKGESYTRIWSCNERGDRAGAKNLGCTHGGLFFIR